MIVKIDNTNNKVVVSGHVFKDDCPDKVCNSADSCRNIHKTNAVIISGHRTKYADKHDVNGVSGHVSGQISTEISCVGHFTIHFVH